MAAKSFPRARTAASRPRPWYQRRGAERFRRDDGIVRARFPVLRWAFDDTAELARLEGSITIEETGGITTTIETRIQFPRDYPESEPVAYEVGKRFPWNRDRHILESNGQCCLWLPPASRWRAQDPDALHAFLDELTVFFHRQLICDVTKRWPGPAWDHGVHGYWEFVMEAAGGLVGAEHFAAGTSLGRNDICPCGSGRRYKRCHLGAHEALARRIGTVELRRLLEWRAKVA